MKGRRSRIAHLATVLPLILLGSCSKPPTVVVMPEYKGSSLDGATLVVAPFHVTILNEDDLEDDLGQGDPVEVYRRFAHPLLAENLKNSSRFDSVVVASQGSRTLHMRQLENVRPLGHQFGYGEIAGQYDDGVIVYGKEATLRMMLPQSSEILQFDNQQPDYVLFLESYSVYTYQNLRYTPNYTPPSVPGGGGGGTFSNERKLIQQTHFAFWDNRLGRLAAYGTARSQAGVTFAMTDNTWKKGVRELAREILRKTPFYSSTTSRRTW